MYRLDSYGKIKNHLVYTFIHLKIKEIIVKQCSIFLDNRILLS